MNVLDSVWATETRFCAAAKMLWKKFFLLAAVGKWLHSPCLDFQYQLNALVKLQAT